MAWPPQCERVHIGARDGPNVYFQNPEFGYYFLRLTTERLIQNIERLEATLADTKTKLQAASQ